MGKSPHTSLMLGVQLAEVEALYASALTAPTADQEQRHWNDLASAAARLSSLAQAAAEDQIIVPTPRRLPPRPTRVLPVDTRLARRVAHAERTARRIIRWSGESGIASR